MAGDPTNNVQWRLSALEKRVDLMEERGELLTALRIELREVKRDLQELVQANQRRDQDQRRQRERTQADRDADKKWKVGIWIAAAAAVISAAAIIVPLLAGG